MPKTLSKEEEIKLRVLEQLDWDARVDASDIRIDVSGNTVALNGAVPSYAMRLLAEQDARTIAGVRSVDNRLEVVPFGPSSLESDQAVEAHIRNLLRFTAGLDEKKLTVSVVGGRAVLEGTVSSFWQKVKVESLVAEVDGVKDIHNKVSVVPTRALEDEAVAEQLTAALDRNLSLDIDHINVEVDRGVATLSGTVNDGTAYRAAEAVARCTDGVTGVKNELIVAPVPSED